MACAGVPSVGRGTRQVTQRGVCQGNPRSLGSSWRKFGQVAVAMDRCRASTVSVYSSAVTYLAATGPEIKGPSVAVFAILPTLRLGLPRHEQINPGCAARIPPGADSDSLGQ